MLKHCLQVITVNRMQIQKHKQIRYTKKTAHLDIFRPWTLVWDPRSSQPVRPLKGHKFSPWMRMIMMILRGVAFFLSRVDMGHGLFMAVPKGIRTVFVRNWFLFFCVHHSFLKKKQTIRHRHAHTQMDIYIYYILYILYTYNIYIYIYIYS